MDPAIRTNDDYNTIFNNYGSAEFRNGSCISLQNTTD